MRQNHGPLGAITRHDARAIGPLGTVTRAAGGLIAIAVLIALSGIGWWDVAAALVAIPLITLALSVLVTATYKRFAPATLSRRYSICSPQACVLVAGIIGVAMPWTRSRR